jgi:hypothetical protein
MSRIADEPFDVELPDQKTGGCSFALVASTRAGKTTLMKYIIDEFFKKHIKVLMSNSIHAEIYKEIDGVVKSPVFSPRIIKEAYEINRKCNNHYPFLYVLDDIVTAKFDKELLKLFTIYRNSGLSCIINVQSPMLLNTASRGNINFMVLGKLNSEEMIEKVIRMYLMTSLEGKMTEKVMTYKKLTEGHHFIMVNNLTGDIYRFKIRV